MGSLGSIWCKTGRKLLAICCGDKGGGSTACVLGNVDRWRCCREGFWARDGLPGKPESEPDLQRVRSVREHQWPWQRDSSDRRCYWHSLLMWRISVCVFRYMELRTLLLLENSSRFLPSCYHVLVWMLSSPEGGKLLCWKVWSSFPPIFSAFQIGFNRELISQHISTAMQWGSDIFDRKWAKFSFSFTNDSIPLFTNGSPDSNKVLFSCKLMGNGCPVNAGS